MDGHPKEMYEFIENHLEAPVGGSSAAKRAVTQKLFESNPGLKEQVEKMVKRNEEKAAAKAARRAEAEARGEVFAEDETATTYHPAVSDHNRRPE